MRYTLAQLVLIEAFRRLRRGCFVLSCLTLLFLGCGVTLFAFSLASRSSAASQPTGSRIVYGLTFMPGGFDPYIDADPELGIVLRSVYDTLVYRDPQTKAIVPGLAEKWDISGDGLTYTFHLKSGVKFQDGTLFDAAAVGATLNRIVNPEAKSQKALQLLGPYDHFAVVDSSTIQIVLKTPYAPLLDSFAQVYLGIASPTALQAYDLTRYQFHQVGSGPYMLVDYVPGAHIILRRNPDYAWGPAFYVPAGPTSIDEIEFRYYIDPATRAPALQSGEAQVMGDLSPVDADLFSRSTNMRLIPQAIPGQPMQFILNTKRQPTDKIEVRQGLLSATDRHAIVDTIFREFSSVAYGPLAAATNYYEPKVKNYYPYDVNNAMKLFGKAGYTLDSTTKILKTANGTALHLVVLIPSTNNAPQVTQKLQSLWHDLGIDAEVKQIPLKADLEAAIQSGAYNLVLDYDFSLDPAILGNYFRSAAALNEAHFSDKKLDQAFDQAVTMPDSPKRSAAYSPIQMRIMDQALILPIRDQIDLIGVSTMLDGLTFDPYGWYPLLANLTLSQAAMTATPTRKAS